MKTRKRITNTFNHDENITNRVLRGSSGEEPRATKQKECDTDENYGVAVIDDLPLNILVTDLEEYRMRRLNKDDEFEWVSYTYFGIKVPDDSEIAISVNHLRFIYQCGPKGYSHTRWISQLVHLAAHDREYADLMCSLLLSEGIEPNPGPPRRRGAKRPKKNRSNRVKPKQSPSGVTTGKKFELNEVRVTNLIPPEWKGAIKSTMYGSLSSVSVNSFMSDAFNMSGLGSAKQLLGSVLSNQTTDISQLRSMYDRYRVKGIKLRITIQSELKLAMKVVVVPTNQVAPLQSSLIVPYSTQPGAITRLLGTLSQANRSATTLTLDINFQKFYGTKQYVLTDGNFTGNTNPSGVPTSPLNSFFLMIGGFEPSSASYAGLGNIIIDIEMLQYITFFERTEQTS
jgi:hypothetical protein